MMVRKLQEFALQPLIWQIQTKRSPHSANGVKATTFCPQPFACRCSLCLNHLHCQNCFGYKSNRAIKILQKRQIDPRLDLGAYLGFTQKQRQALFWWPNSRCLGGDARFRVIKLAPSTLVKKTSFMILYIFIVYCFCFLSFAFINVFYSYDS